MIRGAGSARFIDFQMRLAGDEASEINESKSGFHEAFVGPQLFGA